jgi:hypothetical protein
MLGGYRPPLRSPTSFKKNIFFLLRSPLRSFFYFVPFFLLCWGGYGGGEAGRRQPHRLPPPTSLKKKYGGPPTSLHSRKGVTSLGEAKLGDASRTGYRPPQGCTPYREWLCSFFLLRSSPTSFAPHFVRPPRCCRCLAAELCRQAPGLLLVPYLVPYFVPPLKGSDFEALWGGLSPPTSFALHFVHCTF